MRTSVEYKNLVKELRKHDFYKRYIGDANIDNYKYIKVDYDKDSPQIGGLLDTANQLKDYLRLAYLLNLTLIDPQQPLEPSHDEGRKQNFIFRDYFDIESIKVEGQHVELVEEKNLPDLNSTLVVKSLVYPVHLPKNEKQNVNLFDLQKVLSKKNLPISFDPAEEYKTFSNDFVHKNKIEGCIHIRRGDRLELGCPLMGITPKEMDYGTRTENILDFLCAKNAPKSIYVMTDMKEDDPIIKELRVIKKYQFSFLYDFKELSLVKNQNNYKAFHLEDCIKNHELVKFKSDRFEPVMFLKNKS